MFERTKTIWRRLLGRPAAKLQDGADERRVWVRYPANLAIGFKPAGAPHNTRLSARIRNISIGGINLLSNRAFQPGQLVTVELPGTKEQSPCHVLACIVHCLEEKNGEWSLGCTFSRELSDDDLESFGASRDRRHSSDQRQWKRFPCAVTATYQLAASDDPRQFPAKVLDISASGVGLLVDRAVENGTLLSVELHNAPATTAKILLACVVHMRRQSDTAWALGCNFIRSLSEEDLQALA
jgi:c-di-GMP-binding flagellar brake protein YcgR